MKQVMALAATMMMLLGCGGSEPKAEAPAVDPGPPAWTCQFSNGQTPTVRTEKRRDAMQLCKDYAAQNNMDDSTLIRVEAAQ